MTAASLAEELLWVLLVLSVVCPSLYILYKNETEPMPGCCEKCGGKHLEEVDIFYICHSCQNITTKP